MITSVSNKTIKDIEKLKHKKYQDKYYLVEGFHLVEEAINAGVIKKIITTQKYQSDVEVIEVSEEVLKKLAFTKTPQGIMGICEKRNNKLNPEEKRTLILDNLQDPGNVGTLIRTALALNFKQIVLSKDCVDIYNDKVIRATQGALYKTNIIIEDLPQVINQLKVNNTKIIGSALEGGRPLKEISTSKKVALILGNEGNGIRKDILDLCDEIAFIEINDIESLNVGIAGGILMYYFM
ncbi:MAG: RNA methyltransferase [Thomasclavelia sp.]|nr:RNA methyltransferase [Thomasclavelia sp.]